MIYQILQILLLSWFITRFEPIQVFVVGSLEGINKAFFSKKPFFYTIFGWITKAFYCPKCSSLWIGLLLTYNIYIAIGSAIIMDHYDKWAGSQKIKL